MIRKVVNDGLWSLGLVAAVAIGWFAVQDVGPGGVLVPIAAIALLGVTSWLAYPGENPPEEDLEPTDRTCPAWGCSETLYATDGRLVDVYRCPECRFEGAEAPTSILWKKSPLCPHTKFVTPPTTHS
ncbi:hypothetical protein C479_14203 [Halovivax asiaticus JCM 14624]|uniref:Uncharacterized protein n=1 Tax=Halovivax asiaticus JCM 14624 TaxID=1227490 RepID=M0BDY7_9EURY|nr:hypothetical protein [Halovivax asiaticus]ELZ08498.1 hypothetical protein C479_14203 [Halovivax asiaticus JCM 14624]